jgi:hypothetical protein
MKTTTSAAIIKCEDQIAKQQARFRPEVVPRRIFGLVFLDVFVVVDVNATERRWPAFSNSKHNGFEVSFHGLRPCQTPSAQMGTIPQMTQMNPCNLWMAVKAIP